MTRKSFSLCLIVFAFVIYSTCALASVTKIVVFGDSLSDNGNLFLVTENAEPPAYQKPPKPYYYEGRFSNGPVWVEYLASEFNNAVLEDYAFGGARTGNIQPGEEPIGILAQVNWYFNQTSGMPPFTGEAPDFDNNTLFIVMGGPNDFFQIPPGSTQNEIGLIISGAVSNIMESISILKSNGATQILVPGMPDLGKAPININDATKAANATWITNTFNAGLNAQLDIFEATFTNGTLYRLDTSALLDSIEPGYMGLETFNFAASVNPGSPCKKLSDPPAIEPQDSYINSPKFLFWDCVHPTTKVHMILAAHAKLVIEKRNEVSGDANGDDKVGIEEAIYALQVTSGLAAQPVEGSGTCDNSDITLTIGDDSETLSLVTVAGFELQTNGLYGCVWNSNDDQLGINGLSRTITDGTTFVMSNSDPSHLALIWNSNLYVLTDFTLTFTTWDGPGGVAIGKLSATLYNLPLDETITITNVEICAPILD